MTELFTKPANELTLEHVQKLVGVAVEDHTTEFKVGLTVKDGSPHPWPKSGKVDEHARDDVLKEVVAFANADGGNMIIGMAQSGDAQHQATKIKELPKCKLLADRFRQLSSSWIEPPCLGIEWIGICKDKESDDGVVLVRVPRSRDAPHRLRASKEFYIRRGQDSEPMTVQEIRDITLGRMSDFAELQARLDARREKIRHLLEGANEEGKLRVALRTTLLPIQGRALIQRVYRQLQLFPVLRDFRGTVNGRTVALDVPTSIGELRLMPVRPILRGGRRLFQSTDERFFVEQGVHGDGLVEIFFHFEPHGTGDAPVFIGWVMGFVANALIMAESVRQVAEIPSAEMALDIEIGSSQPHLNLTLGGFSELQHAGVGEVESGTIQANPLHLPRYTVLGADEFPLVAATVLNDLRESAGLPAMDDFILDFGHA